MSPSARRDGVWLAFLGPDGSGKSSVLDGVSLALGPAFDGVRRFHLRPHGGRRRSGHAPVTDPHGRQRRGAVVSWVKLAWWWLDCWTGYLVTIRPALQRSVLILFDRYVYDLQVDPRRYRYAGSSRLAGWIARRVPRPDLVIVLDAPVEVLRERKVEVPEEETVRQREAYRRLATSLAHAHLVDASRPLAEVVEEIAGLVGNRRPEVPACRA
jgi:thymidylate kinase